METGESVLVAEGEKNEAEEDKNYKKKEEEMVVDLEVLRDCFTPGLNGEVPLEPYLNAFSEMNNFFKVLGSLFHFVAYDVNRKVALVRAELVGETRQHYIDVRTMLDYEVETGLVERTSPPSASKTFLNLHRALEFVSDFLKYMVEEEEEPSLGQVTSTLYKATVGRFHPPILSTPFAGLLLLLPDRATIRSRCAKGNPEAEAKLKKLLPEIIKAVKETYAACQTLYQDRNLLLID